MSEEDMKRKWVNSAIALMLVLSVFLGACSNPVSTPAPATPQSPVSTPAPATPQSPVSTAATATPQSPVSTAATATPQSPVSTAGTATPKPAVVPSTPAPKPTLKPEKVTVLVDTFGVEKFLPHMNQGGTTYKLMPSFEALWDIDPNTGQLVPMLAETLPQYSEDNKTLYVNLRQGVEFHDGWGEMTAEDVKFTIELVGRQDSMNPDKSAVANLKVEILGPYKLAINFPAPVWNWATNTGARGYRFTLPIVSKKQIEKVGENEAARNPAGTGPFKLVKHEIGQSLEFEGAPNHWRLTPGYKTLLLKVVTEPATAISMLRTGEADVAAIPLIFVPEARAAGLEIRQQRGIGVIGVALGGQYLPSQQGYDPNVPWVLAKEPEKALKVRKALNLAVNRQEIIDNVLNGIGGQWPIIASPNADASYDPSWKPYPYDPEQAKRLLAEAGYPNGFETTMSLFASTGHATREVGEAVAIYWEKIGIKVKRLPIDYAAHRDRQAGRKYAGIVYPVYRNYAAEEMMNPNSWYTSQSIAANFQFAYPQIDDLAKRGLTEVNTGKRLALAYEMHKIMYENYYSVPVSLENMTVGVGKRIGEWPRLESDAFLTNFEYIKLK
ncbi:MAG: hypothetical protein HY673_06620 [Chloroflexi bacterium]|nr:hypothetical protein [Chloroflexota bacterium]